MSFISDNIGNILVGLILLLLVWLIIRSLINDKKAGKSTCSHDCTSCGMGSSCTQVAKFKNDFKKASETRKV